MIQIKEKKKCCGCESCVQICPKKCIKLVPDKEGFLYPEVDTEQCVNCNKCDKVCPVLNYKEPDSLGKCYVVQNNNIEIVKQSASGGAFSIFADYILDKNGVVFGAAYSEDLSVEHIYIESKDQIEKLRCSKYVQSYIGNSFKQTKLFLDNGRFVCFAGTPCQIYGLYLFLGKKKYPNLLTVDFACHGVPSPKVWRKYLGWLSEKNDKKLMSYRFRDKRLGYQYTTFVATYSDGEEYVISDANNDRDFMKDSFFRDVISRPSCYDCRFKSVNHVSDVTMFDCWHNVELTGGNDFVDGATTIIIHSDKAYDLFDEISRRAKICETDLDEAVRLDGVCLIYSKLPFVKRKEYFDDLEKMSVNDLSKKYFFSSGNNKLKETIKAILKKVGLFDKIRNIISKKRMKEM